MHRAPCTGCFTESILKNCHAKNIQTISMFIARNRLSIPIKCTEQNRETEKQRSYLQKFDFYRGIIRRFSIDLMAMNWDSLSIQLLGKWQTDNCALFASLNMSWIFFSSFGCCFFFLFVIHLQLHWFVATKQIKLDCNWKRNVENAQCENLSAWQSA